jgi:hypothetical protein
MIDLMDQRTALAIRGLIEGEPVIQADDEEA